MTSRRVYKDAIRHDEALAIIEAIREVIAEEFEIQPAAVVLIKSGTLPKTSSGKVRRATCRENFLTNSLRVISEWRAPTVDDQKVCVPAAPVELNPQTIGQWLRLLLTAKLNIEAQLIDDQPISHYGIDSLLALELAHAVETGLGVKLSLTNFLGNRTLADLTNEILMQLAQAKPAPTDTPVSSPGENGEYSLSHGQQALWALQQVAPESTAYNVWAVARIHDQVDAGAMRRALHAMVQRHPMLRARHLPFSIGNAERDAWLACMRRAMSRISSQIGLPSVTPKVARTSPIWLAP